MGRKKSQEGRGREEVGGWERKGRMLRRGVQAGRAGAAGGTEREKREKTKRETFCVYLRTSDKEESLSSDLGRAEN